MIQGEGIASPELILGVRYMQVFCVGLLDITGDNVTGDFLQGHFLHYVRLLESKYGVPVVGIATDAAAACRKGRRGANVERPDILMLDCLSHMVSLLSHHLQMPLSPNPFPALQ